MNTRQELRTWDRLPFSARPRPVMATRRKVRNPQRHVIRMLAIVDVLAIALAFAAAGGAL